MTTTYENVQEVILRFLARYVDDPLVLAHDRLITSGILDSLAAVEMIAHLERQFSIEVLDEDLEIENFDSIKAITAFVERKTMA